VRYEVLKKEFEKVEDRRTIPQTTMLGRGNQAKRTKYQQKPECSSETRTYEYAKLVFVPAGVIFLSVWIFAGHQ